jgi:hypothetical protein
VQRPAIDASAAFVIDGLGGGARGVGVDTDKGVRALCVLLDCVQIRGERWRTLIESSVEKIA